MHTHSRTHTYVHTHTFTHTYTHTANILVTVDGDVKLTDFGASLLKQGSNVAMDPMGIAGTPNYMAPEMLKSIGDGSYSYNVDIWSLGITLIEMLTAERPFDECTNQFAVMFAIAKLDAPPEIPEYFSDDTRAFLSLCLQPNPDQRPSAQELLAHTFLNRWDEPMDLRMRVVDSFRRRPGGEPKISSSSVDILAKHSSTSFSSLTRGSGAWTGDKKFVSLGSLSQSGPSQMSSCGYSPNSALSTFSDLSSFSNEVLSRDASSESVGGGDDDENEKQEDRKKEEIAGEVGERSSDEEYLSVEEYMSWEEETSVEEEEPEERGGEDDVVVDKYGNLRFRLPETCWKKDMHTDTCTLAHTSTPVLVQRLLAPPPRTAGPDASAVHTEATVGDQTLSTHSAPPKYEEEADQEEEEETEDEGECMHSLPVLQKLHHRSVSFSARGGLGARVGGRRQSMHIEAAVGSKRNTQRQADANLAVGYVWPLFRIMCMPIWVCVCVT